MSTPTTIGVRQSVRYLQNEYDNGNKKPLEDLVRAWKGIKELPPTDKRSFFVLGGYHGEPFEYRRDVDALSLLDRYTYWGGFCNHGNVLFPTWHRIYVLKVEEALQSIVPGVMMPFWDETSPESLDEGIPSVLTQLQFSLDGDLIDNPLRSFILPKVLSDNVPGEDQAYLKPKGYRTVRYPLSGLVGTSEAQAETKSHNDLFPNQSENVRLLDENIKAWLNGPEPKTINDNSVPSPGVYSKFQNCLLAENYTVFSNTTSAGQWNLDHPNAAEPLVSLESPHNDVHLAVGGFDAPHVFQAGKLAGANGDMGENNTAALDPIFFFHHCNVDRMFWLWQQRHHCNDTEKTECTKKLEIIKGYYGTSSSDSQGPTPNFAPGTPLTIGKLGVPPAEKTPLDIGTPLYPFVKDEFGTIYTSEDCVNIETLGYTYGKGSLDEAPVEVATPTGSNTRKLTVRGIDRALFQGSFVLRAYAKIHNASGETDHYLGHEAILSRRNVVHCANCLTHQEVIVHLPLTNVPAADLAGAAFRLEIQHRGSELPQRLSYSFEVMG